MNTSFFSAAPSLSLLNELFNAIVYNCYLYRMYKNAFEDSYARNASLVLTHSYLHSNSNAVPTLYLPPPVANQPFRSLAGNCDLRYVGY
jgi:hypothetical protein